MGDREARNITKLEADKYRVILFEEEIDSLFLISIFLSRIVDFFVDSPFTDLPVSERLDLFDKIL